MQWKEVALLVLRSVGLFVGAKPNVPLVRLVKIVFKKCGSAKKIKHEALSFRVGKKSIVKFICRPVVSIVVCQFISIMVVVSSVTLVYYYTLFPSITTTNSPLGVNCSKCWCNSKAVPRKNSSYILEISRAMQMRLVGCSSKLNSSISFFIR